MRFKNQCLTWIVGTALVLGGAETSSASSIIGIGPVKAIVADIPANKIEDANAVAALLNLGNGFWTNAGAGNNVASLFRSSASGTNRVLILPAWTALNRTANDVVILDRGHGNNWVLKYTKKPAAAGSASNVPSAVNLGAELPIAASAGTIQLLILQSDFAASATTPTETVTVPEPSSLLELCTGLLLLTAVFIHHRRRTAPQTIRSAAI